MIPWQRGASIAKTEKAAPGVNLGGFVVAAKSGSALRELLRAAGAVQTGLLALDFTGITRHEPGLAQRGLERGFVVDQGAGDAVARGAGLAGFAATVDIDLDVEGFDMLLVKTRGCLAIMIEVSRPK
jgi:hypothetical protein